MRNEKEEVYDKKVNEGSDGRLENKRKRITDES